MRSDRIPLASGASVNGTWIVLEVAYLPTGTRRIHAFTGYPMAGLTERAGRIISMTYPVVI
jgi:hypothetical protein